MTDSNDKIEFISSNLTRRYEWYIIAFIILFCFAGIVFVLSPSEVNTTFRIVIAIFIIPANILIILCSSLQLKRMIVIVDGGFYIHMFNRKLQLFLQQEARFYQWESVEKVIIYHTKDKSKIKKILLVMIPESSNMFFTRQSQNELIPHRNFLIIPGGLQDEVEILNYLKKHIITNKFYEDITWWKQQ